MRAKKKIIIISLLVAVICMAIFTIALFFCDNRSKCIEWVKTISAGILTSALVTLFVSIGEYFVAKKRAFEDFYRAENILLNQYLRLRYLDTRLPYDLLYEYLREEYMNATGFPEPASQAQQAVKEYLWHNLPDALKKAVESDSSKEDHIERMFEYTVKEDKAKIDSIIRQYLTFADEASLEDLSMAYVDIDLILDNGKIRNTLLYDKILKGHQKALNTILDLTYHLKLYEDTVAKGDQGNLPVIFSMILEVQQFLFDKQEEAEYTAVYNKFAMSMDRYAYELLKYIYGKKLEGKEPNKRRYYVMGIYREKHEESA